MNALVENGIISEMECGNNFAYIINDSNLFCQQNIRYFRAKKKVVLLNV